MPRYNMLQPSEEVKPAKQLPVEMEECCQLRLFRRDLKLCSNKVVTKVQKTSKGRTVKKNTELFGEA